MRGPPRTDDKPMRTVLVIDDNHAVGTALELVFALREIRTLVAYSPEDGLKLLELSLIHI